MKEEKKKKGLANAVDAGTKTETPIKPEGTNERLKSIPDAIVVFFSKLIHDSLKNNASTILIQGACSANSDAKIRIRVDGVVKTVETIDFEKRQKICEAIKIMANMDVNEKQRPQDGRIQLRIDGRSVDLRISIVPCSVFGENISIRILSKESLCLDLAKCGMSEAQMKTVRSWYSKPHGLVLVTGPTGSGKTTVLYMILNELNKETNNVYTVEEPVEYIFDGITQIQVNSRAGLTFGQSIRVVLRQDADVIMVGEIRDLETAQLIVQSVLTGHLVLSTLHTNTATDAVIRLKDIGVEPFLIRDTITGIISQRLVRVLCKDCRKKYMPDDITLQHFGLKKQEYYKAVGCKNCGGAGYRGRIGIFELYEPNHAIVNMLVKGCDGEEFRRQAINGGMVTLFQDGIAKAAQGITSLEEVIWAAGGTI